MRPPGFRTYSPVPEKVRFADSMPGCHSYTISPRAGQRKDGPMAKARQTTLTERAKLEGLLATARQGDRARHLWPLLVAATVAPAIFTLLALLVLGFLAMLAGFPLAEGAWRTNPVTYGGAIAVPLLIWSFTLSSTIRWSLRSRRAQRQRISDLEADLARGEVQAETHEVTAIKLLREAEHGMLVIFLRLSNGKCFVLYDHASANSGAGAVGGSQPAPAPARTFNLLTFPVSKARSWSFSGEPLPLPTPSELAADDWPDDESWCRIRWDEIERHYGGKRR